MLTHAVVHLVETEAGLDQVRMQAAVYEASLMARVRPLLLDKGLAKESLKVAAYWKAGASAFHDTLGD